MLGFGKKKKQDEQPADEQAVAAVANGELEDTAEEASSTSDEAAVFEFDFVEFSRVDGPWDSSEKKTDSDSYIDLGGLLIKSSPGLNLRLEADQKTQQVIAVTLQLGEGTVQIQAFAAPKSRGIWDEIRAEISESVRRQGGKVEINDGPLGRQLISRLPAQTADGRKGYRIARFVGVDGPRWFVRGVFTGNAVFPGESAAALEEIFRSVVVHRGSDPMAPRDLLPMAVPQSIQQAAAAQAAEAKTDQKPSLQVPRRGPEIAEVR